MRLSNLGATETGPNDDELERLIELDALYFSCGSNIEKTVYAWRLQSDDVRDYHDANRALRLRDDGRGAAILTREVVRTMRAAGLVPVLDLDRIARSKGFANAATEIGLHPNTDPWLLMRHDHAVAHTPSSVGEIEVVEVDRADINAIRTWVEIASSDHVGSTEFAMWRAVAEREAAFQECRLFVGRLNSVPTGACLLFSTHGWGRIESVATVPSMRGRGVATTVVSRALAESVASGNEISFLFTEAGGAARRVYERLGFVAWEVDTLHRYVGP